MDMTTFCIQ